MKRHMLAALSLSFITIVLELLPYGAVLNFASPEETFRKTFSYFDLTPFGYANFGPLLTAVLTCIIFLVLIIYCFCIKESLLKMARNFTYICIVVSLSPLLFGIRYFSIVGAFITVSLVALAICLNMNIKAVDPNR